MNYGKCNLTYKFVFMAYEIKTHYVNDDVFNLPFENLSRKFKYSKEIEQFKSHDLRDVILYYNARVCIHKVGQYRLNIMHDFCYILIGCHPSFPKTYATIFLHYYCPCIKRDIHEYVEQCIQCQTCKVQHIQISQVVSTTRGA